MRTTFALFLLFAVVLATPGPITWTVCSGENAHGKIDSVDIDPNPVVPFTNTTAYGKGSLDKRITEGATWKMTGSYKGIPVLKKSGNLCEDSVVNLPLKSGNIFIEGLKCPQEPGTLKVVEKALFKVNPPSGVYKIDVTFTDQDNEEILCLAIDVPM